MNKYHPLSNICLTVFVFPTLGHAIELPDLVVTTSKYEQPLSEVAASVTVLSEDQLTQYRAYDFQTIGSLIPNVTVINNDLAGLGGFRIRGLGINEFQANFEGPVTVNIDDVPFTKPFMLGDELFDVERIEVLKGLQSQTYGRNTIGGAVNIYSKQPTPVYEAGARSSLDNYISLRNEAYITGPISDNVNARLAVVTHTANSGPFYNEYTDDRLGEKDFYALRNSYQSTLGETELNFSFHASRNKDELPPYGNQLGKKDAAKPTSYTVNQDYYPIRDNESAGGVFKLTRPVFSDSVFTSITAFEYVKRDQREDSDDSPTATLNVDWFTTTDQFSQEFRFHGPVMGDFWQHSSGFYFLHEQLEEVDSIDYSDNAFLSAVIGISPARMASDFEQEVTSWSAYSTHEFALSESNTFVMGARYTHERTALKGQSFIGTATTTGERNESTPIVMVDEPDVSRTDEEVTFHLGFNYQIAEQKLVYTSVSTGFRSGGYDLGFGAPLETFEPEDALSIEAGFRSSWLENSLNVDLAVFRTEIDDYQTNVDFVGQIVPRRTNIGELVSQGAELSVLWQPTAAWLFNFAMGYTDAEISSDKTVTGVPIDGNTPVRTPEFSIGAGLSYTHKLQKGLKLVSNAFVDWNDEQYMEVQNLPQHLMEDYYTLDARISLMPVSEKWSVSLWGKNITDQEYLLYINDIQPLTFLTINSQPARYGVEFSYRFD